MPPAPENVVLFDGETARAVRTTTALGARSGPLTAARRLAFGAQFVLAFAAPADWPALVRRLWSWRAIPLVVVPLGPPAPLPRGTRPITRFLLPSQAAARDWGAHIPLGRLVVIEPAPAATAQAVFVATAADLLDPEALVAACRGGAAVVVSAAVAAGRHGEGLPPGAVVTDDVAAEKAALLTDDARRARLGGLAAKWASERRAEDEAAALWALRTEVIAMARRGGRR